MRDGLVFRDVSTVSPEQALEELQRVDNSVEFEQNWAILRRMMDDDAFKNAVLAAHETQNTKK